MLDQDVWITRTYQLSPCFRSDFKGSFAFPGDSVISILWRMDEILLVFTRLYQIRDRKWLKFYGWALLLLLYQHGELASIQSVAKEMKTRVTGIMFSAKDNAVFLYFPQSKTGNTYCEYCNSAENISYLNYCISYSICGNVCCGI